MVHFETEPVPAEKKFKISTRDNSEYKWQDAGKGHIVIGALEVPCEPTLQLRETYKPHKVQRKEAAFDAALAVWKEWKLRDQFIQTCENIPPEMGCCGLLTDYDETMKNLVKTLNPSWVSMTNDRLQEENKGFKINLFIWMWHNASGKSETNILMIRFIESAKTSPTIPEEADSEH